MPNKSPIKVEELLDQGKIVVTINLSMLDLDLNPIWALFPPEVVALVEKYPNHEEYKLTLDTTKNIKDIMEAFCGKKPF